MLVSRGEIDRIRPYRARELKIGIVASLQTGHLQRELEKLVAERIVMDDKLRTSDSLIKDLVGSGSREQRMEQAMLIHERASQ